jgi:hypothetical protein
MRWLKKWGVLLVAALALLASGYAIYQDNVHYQEITKPHTQHDEIYNRLVRLDEKIERTEQNISTQQDTGHDVTDSQEALMQAIELRDQAELAWDEGNYTEADRLISEAHDVLGKIPAAFYFQAYWFLVIIISAVVLSLGLSLVIGKAKGKNNK